MTVYKFKLRLISPAFIAGTDKNMPEMRAASIRGQLRYWLRAMIGASTSSLADVWQKESKVFGSTSNGSAVSVRVYRDSPEKYGSYAMLPHRANDNQRSYQKALNPGQLYDLELVTPPGMKLPDDVLNALKLWSLLGGIGRRSRRMFGAVQITANEGWYSPPQDSEALVTLIRDCLKQVASAPPSHIVPDFPTLNLAHSWVIVGRIAYDDYEAAVKELFTNILRRSPHLEREKAFGGIRPRRSSPLIAQIRRIQTDEGNLYYPILTALRSKPDDTHSGMNWKHLQEFMEEAEVYFHADRVWGGW